MLLSFLVNHYLIIADIFRQDYLSIEKRLVFQLKIEIIFKLEQYLFLFLSEGEYKYKMHWAEGARER